MERIADLLEEILSELKELNKSVSELDNKAFSTSLELKDLSETVGGKLGYNMQDLFEALGRVEERLG